MMTRLLTTSDKTRCGRKWIFRDEGHWFIHASLADQAEGCDELRFRLSREDQHDSAATSPALEVIVTTTTTTTRGAALTEFIASSSF